MRSQITVILIALTTLTSCSNVSPTQPSNMPLSANQYLQIADDLPLHQNESYQLEATRQYLNDHQDLSANKILLRLKKQNLPPSLNTQYLFLKARYNTENKHYQTSQSELNQIIKNKTTLSPKKTIKWYTLAAENSQGVNDTVSTLNNLKALSSLISPDDTRFNKILDDSWHALQSADPKVLAQLFNRSNDPYIKGWIALHNITNTDSLKQAPFSRSIINWKTQHPNHIANYLLPKTLQSLPSPQLRIGLLLPSKGLYSESAKAIRNGILSAYFQAHASSPKQTITINIYDTSTQPATHAYQLATQEGNNIIIGPLSKTAVNEINQSDALSTPTIALNTLPSTSTPQPNLYQLSLSASDETQQIVAKAREDQHRRIIIIAPNSRWGQQIANAFSSEWTQAGGEIISQMNYNNTHSLSFDIRHLLNLDKSYLREKKISRLLHTSLRMTPRRRQDFDSIFLIANTPYAKQIRPLLKFYYAGNIPIYALSNVYQGNVDLRRDRDLNGILFCDQPWVLNKKLDDSALNTIRTHAKKSWPHLFYTYPKLFALGVDAFNIAHHFNRVTQLPKLGFAGATGTLHITSNRKIIPQRQWSYFSSGKAIA
jgi:uncharacterized protein